MAKNLQAGEIVKNFSAIVRVEVIEERGALVTIIPWTLNGVAQGGVGQRYYADPAKCSRLSASER